MQRKQKLKVAAAGTAAMKGSGSLDILRVKTAKATVLPERLRFRQRPDEDHPKAVFCYSCYRS